MANGRSLHGHLGARGCAGALLARAGTIFLLTLGPPSVLAQTRYVGDPIQGRHLAQAKCAACHGLDGNGTAQPLPKIAGQNSAYLYRQLWAFKTGARKSAVMAGVVAPLSDSDFADAAAYFAQQSIRPDPVKDEALVSAGERVFIGHRGPGMTGSCAACHTSSGQPGITSRMGRRSMGGGMMGGGMMGGGMMGGGMMGGGATAAIPSLNGQHAAYIVDQLNRFAAGEQQGAPMGPIAASLSEAERSAVAEYLSTQR